jgi:general secretion pathway protein C
VETLLRKYLWAIDLAVVALCSTFLGNAASSAVESKLVASIPTPAPSANKTRRPEPTTTGNKLPEGILRRNIFCSTCPPILDDQNPDGGVPENPPAVEPVKTQLPLALLAIMYAPPPNSAFHMTWSLAIIRDTEIKSTGPYSMGGKVHGATVTEIEETRIYLDNAGKPEFLDLIEKPTPPTPPPSAAPSAAGGTDPLSIEMDKGIKKTGENTYEIQRGTLESVLGNIGLLSRSARIVPEMRDGKAAGFRLYAVKPDGPFAKIGMQNGDVISSINGLELTSPEKALEVYAKLKSASHLSLGLETNGKKVTKDYTIR